MTAFSNSLPRAALVLAFLGLTACVPTTGANVSTNTDIAALDASTQRFVEVLATAKVLANACAAQGIRRTASDSSDALAHFRAMRAQGYSQQQINSAVDGVDRAAAVQNSIQYLTSNGAAPGSGTEATCGLARSEITRQSSVGQYLRLG